MKRAVRKTLWRIAQNVGLSGLKGATGGSVLGGLLSDRSLRQDVIEGAKIGATVGASMGVIDELLYHVVRLKRRPLWRRLLPW